MNEMNTRFNTQVTVLSFESVGPSIGALVAERAAGAVGLATLGILGFITYAFRGVKHAYPLWDGCHHRHAARRRRGGRRGGHPGAFFGVAGGRPLLTALLTVIGFSVHDSIVVFDRIRENANVHRRLDYETLVNHSIVQTLDRSINTQLTVALTLLALLLLGGVTTTTLRHDLVGGRVQRHLLIDLQRLPDPGGVGEPRVDHLVPSPSGGPHQLAQTGPASG